MITPAKVSILLLAIAASACGGKSSTAADSLLASSVTVASLSVRTADYLPEAQIFHNGLGSGTTRYSNSLANFRVDLDTRAAFRYVEAQKSGIIDAVAGETLHLDFHKDALALGQTGTITGVTLQYRLPGEGVVRELALQGDAGVSGFQAALATDATKAGALEYWFVVALSNGSNVYDSDFGRNYAVILLPSTCAAAKFDAIQDPGNWPAVQIQGTLTANGSALCLDYAKSRAYAMGLQNNSTHGVSIPPAVIAYAQYFDADGNVTNDLEIHPDFLGSKVALPVPAGTKRVSVWFRLAEYSGKFLWDSNFSANYNFEVQ